MQRYILRRSAQGLLAIVAISMIVFALARVTGDPTNVLLPDEASEEQIMLTRIEWGLDKPLHIQYWVYV
ncbi:MAG: ABC transporter permease, partial [Chloroflexi bacterium]|nr:ABC transporter permease [Chloroflexota bacterium]